MSAKISTQYTPVVDFVRSVFFHPHFFFHILFSLCGHSSRFLHIPVLFFMGSLEKAQTGRLAAVDDRFRLIGGFHKALFGDRSASGSIRNSLERQKAFPASPGLKTYPSFSPDHVAPVLAMVG